MIAIARQTEGYTLPEVLLVVAIMAIVAGAAVPRLSASLEEMRLDDQAQAAAEAFRRARDLALLRQRPVQVAGGVDSQELLLSVIEEDDTLSPVSDYLGGRVSLAAPGHDYLSASDLPVAGLVFDAQGIPSAEATLTLSAGERQRTIRIDPLLGSVEVTAP